MPLRGLQSGAEGQVTQESNPIERTDMKKKHWTQTPAGKKKLSQMRKKAWKAQRRKTDEEFEDESLSVRGDARMADLLSVKRKPQYKRPKAVAVVNAEDISIKDLLKSLFERAEEVQEAARQIADKLGLEM